MSMHRRVITLVALVLASVSAAPALAAQQGSVVLPIADARTRTAVEREIARAAAKGLPVQPLIAKANEGVAKQASGERIQEAVASLAKRLEQARALLAPSMSVAELASGADASLIVKVRNGVPPFTFFANGAPFGRSNFARQNAWRPDGPGYVTLSVVDAEGRSDMATVFLE